MSTHPHEHSPSSCALPLPSVLQVRQGAAATPTMKEQKAGWRTYQLDGPLFFASTQTFGSLFDVKNDPRDVVVDFMDSRVMDHSALEAINTLAERYGAAGKRVHLRHLSSDCVGLLARLNGDCSPYELECGFDRLPSYEIIEPDAASDPVYEVAEDSKFYKGVVVPKLSCCAC